MADLNLSFPYPINYNAENISKELEEYGQLLNKTLLVKEGLTYKEYNSMIDTDKAHRCTLLQCRCIIQCR